MTSKFFRYTVITTLDITTLDICAVCNECGMWHPTDKRPDLRLCVCHQPVSSTVEFFTISTIVPILSMLASMIFAEAKQPPVRLYLIITGATVAQPTELVTMVTQTLMGEIKV